MKILNRSTVVFTLVMLMFAFSTVQEARAQGGPLRIMTSKLPDGAVNTSYTFTADGAGGTGAYTWSASGLPAGLSIGSSGQITGTPTTACNCSVTLTLKDVTLTTVTKTLPLNIYAPLAITTTSLPSGTVGAAYSQALTATGGNSTYSWSLSSGSLPAGLTLSAAGVISGPPTTVGMSNFTVRVDSGSQTATKALSITIVSVPLSITTTSPLTAGMVGAPYSQTLAATGGATPYAWTLASGSLPGGLTLSGAGAISGTPTTAGIFNFTIQVAGGQTASAGFAITIDPAPAALSITTNSPLSPGVVAAPYSQTLTATGGTAPYTWLVTAGALPPGLTLSAGTISGSPTTAGSFNFTVQVMDNATRTASKPFSLTINPALSIITASPLSPGVVGIFYSQTLAATGGATPYTWTLASGSLPAGLTLSGAGAISGTPTTAGIFNFTIQVAGGQTASAGFSITIDPAPAALSITTNSPLSPGVVAAPYSQTLTATGGTAPYTWLVTAGALPPGLTLSAGTISGSPTTAGSFNFTVQITDNATRTASKPFSLTINPALSIITASPLSAGVVGISYSQTLAATGGATPYTWTLASGSLPAGLTLSGAGAIGGTPTTAGIFNFTIQVAGGSQTASAAFSITIDPAPAALSITTTSPLSPGVVAAPYSQTLTATGGTAPYTWLVTAGALPPGLTLSAGTISGSPTTAGSFNFTVQITDNATRTASKPFSLTINPALSIITASPLSAGVVEISYSQTLAATGGATPYAWTLASGSLPAGLTLSGAGAIGGTPTTAGIFNFTIQVAGGSQTASAAFSITIDPAPAALSITTTSPLSPGVVAAPYSQTLTATGGTAPYTWLVTAGALPPGLTLSAGTISGSPTTAGPFNFTLQVTDNATRTASKPFSLTINPALSITTASPLSPGVVEISYSQTLAATGGATPYAWTLASGSLPAGLTLSGAGTIGGTPTTAGIFNFTVQVAGGSQTASAAFSITIDPAPAALSITTTSPLSPGVVAAPYSQTLTATGGTTPYTWLVTAGALPPGLTLSAGTISGSPTTAGSFNFTVQITDNATRTASKPFSLTINPALSIITASPLSAGVVEISYSQTLAATGGATPYAWTLASGSLPAGLTLSGAGTIGGTPTTAGTFNFTIQVAGGSQTASAAFSITIDPAALSIITTPLSSGVVAAPYSQNLTATGGTAPYTWLVTAGALPPGLTLSATGTISGSPTTAGSFNFTVQVTDNATRTASKPFSITINAVFSITTASPLQNGMVSNSYSQTLAAAGGTTPYTWSVISGSLPEGLTLSAAGVVSGAPTTAGTFTFTAQVADSVGLKTSTAFSITIDPQQLSITTASPLATAVIGASYSQTLTAAGGTTPYTWSVISGALPTGLTLPATGSIGGTPTAAGAFSFTVEVVDSSPSPQRISKAYSIQIVTILTINPNPLISGYIGIGYGQTLTATGGSLPYSWSLASGSLPPGITLSSSGELSGTPTTSGVSSFTVRVTDSATTPQASVQAFTIVVVTPLAITSPTALNNASTDSTYSVALTALGGTLPYSWSVISGELPPGLSLSSSGILSGTPTIAGVFTFLIQVNDASGTSISKSFSLTVQTGLIITTVSPLPGAVIASFYSMQVQASFPEPLIWSLVSGNLPGGLDLSSSGLISGIPTSVGAYQFTIQVAGGAPAQTATQIFALQVSSGLLITTNSELPAGTSSATYIASLSATGGVGPYGWTQTGGSMPDGLSLSNSGLISGTPTRAGIFTFTVQVSDSSSLKTTKTLTVSIVPSALGSFSLTGVPATVNPTQQMPVGLLLSGPQPTPLAGSLVMTFTSSSAVPADDPVVQFSTGSRTVNFTIPAGSTTAVFPTPVFLLTGTVSGTVVLTANIQDGPTAIPVQSVVIQPTVPQMTNVAAVRTTNGLRVQVTGYSPGRRVINAEFGFDLKAAAGGQRVNLTRSVESDFDGWYRSSASSAFGSSFSFEQLFRVQGDPSMIESVTITLTNEVGSATSIRAQIP